MNKKDIENLNLLSEGVLGNVAKGVAKGAAALGRGAYKAATSDTAKKGYAAAGRGALAAGKAAAKGAQVAGSAAGETLKHYGHKAAAASARGMAGVAGYLSGNKQKAKEAMNAVKLHHTTRELSDILSEFEVDISKSGVDLSQNQEYQEIKNNLNNLINYRF